jgi:hypothetical protein
MLVTNAESMPAAACCSPLVGLCSCNGDSLREILVGFNLQKKRRTVLARFAESESLTESLTNIKNSSSSSLAVGAHLSDEEMRSLQTIGYDFAPKGLYKPLF